MNVYIQAVETADNIVKSSLYEEREGRERWRGGEGGRGEGQKGKQMEVKLRGGKEDKTR